MEKAVFGGGCFWCTEAVFKMIDGVSLVLPGYAGGTTKNPTYSSVSLGNTGHAEVIQIEYNTEKVVFKDLLTVFFGSHDSTTRNRQGNDVGTQYRSIVLYTTPEQKAEIEEFIKELEASNTVGNHVTTEVVPLDIFYPAEDYHKDYFSNHSEEAYCQVIIAPKLEKVQQKYAELLNKIQK